MFYYLAISLPAFGGDDGLPLAARSVVPGLPLRGDLAFYYFTYFMAGLAFVLLYRLVASRFGRALVAIRENERRMAAIGYPVYRLKLMAFTLSGGLAGLAGALLANLSLGVTPHTLTWHQSGLLMVMVIIGGSGYFWGGITGAAIFLLLEETISEHTEHWNLILGAMLLFIVMAAPDGVMSLRQHLYRPASARGGSGPGRRQVFGKFGWQDARSDLDLPISYADNKMNGNGLQEGRLLEQDYSGIYTQPDITKNRWMFLNLTANHSLNDTTLLSGNVYYRKINSSTYNGDLNENALENQVYQPNQTERDALTAAGYSGFPTAGANAGNTPFPYWRCIANTLLADEPNEKCTGLINTTRTSQESFGLSGQLSLSNDLAVRKNLFIAGAAYDQSNIHFEQSGGAWNRRWHRRREGGSLQPDAEGSP